MANRTKIAQIDQEHHGFMPQIEGHGDPSQELHRSCVEESSWGLSGVITVVSSEGRAKLRYWAMRLLSGSVVLPSLETAVAVILWQRKVSGTSKLSSPNPDARVHEDRNILYVV